MKLLMSSNGRNKNGISIKGKGYDNNNDACFQNIGGFPPINVKVEKGNQLLVMLNVPDTWCDEAGEGGWFGIKVNDRIVTRGYYSIAVNGQRVPISLQTVVDCPSDQDLTIQAVWCNSCNTATCSIGSYSESVLTAFVNDWNTTSAQLGDFTKMKPNIPGMK